jgi:hypothetical protein
MIRRSVSNYAAIAAATIAAAGVLAAFGPADPAPGDLPDVEAVFSRAAPAAHDAKMQIMVGERLERSQRERRAQAAPTVRT